MNPTYWLRAGSEELIIDLVHRNKVVHSGDEDVDLDNIAHAASGFFENSLDVLQDLSLYCRSIFKYL